VWRLMGLNCLKTFLLFSEKRVQILTLKFGKLNRHVLVSTINIKTVATEYNLQLVGGK